MSKKKGEGCPGAPGTHRHPRWRVACSVPPACLPAVVLTAAPLSSADLHGGLPALVGIGVTFKRDKARQCYIVKRVIESGPAALNGEVQPLDEFHEVDGEKVAAKSPEELTKMVLGPSGSRVDLTIIRNGDFVAVPAACTSLT